MLKARFFVCGNGAGGRLGKARREVGEEREGWREWGGGGVVRENKGCGRVCGDQGQNCRFGDLGHGNTA